MELTKKVFIEELMQLVEKGAHFNVESEDSGNAYFSLGGCSVNCNLDDGLDGEIVFFKPNADMEITFDFSIVDYIVKISEKSYRMEFNANISNVYITIVA